MLVTSIIFLILIIAFIVVIFVVIKSTNSLSIPVKYKKYLVILFCAILLISTFVLFYLTKYNLINNTKANAEIINIPNSLDFNELSTQGKLSTSNWFVQKRKWSFDYSGKLLTITNIQGNNGTSSFILVERKNIDDGKIEVINYVTRSTVNGIDITDKIKPTSVELIKDNLTVNYGLNQPIKLNQYNPDIAIHQFMKSSQYKYEIGLNQSTFFGMKIVSIKIPKSLQIDKASSDNIQMIN